MIADAGSPLDVVRDGVERFVSEQLGRPARVERLQLLAGGASQEAWAVDLAVDAAVADSTAGERLQLVLRRDLGGVLTLVTLDRATEFAVISAAYAAGVPVPRPYFKPGSIAGKPAFFMQRVSGEAVGRRVVTDPALAKARELLPAQLAQALAAIHRVDYRANGVESRLQHPRPSQSAIAVELDRLYRELDEVDEPHPVLELALRRLVRDEPSGPARVTLVHGDFRIGNVLVADDGLRAVLDWEFAHVGDPYEDLGWFCVRAWRFGNDALEAGGITDRETWLREYERASGERVDRARVEYMELLGNVKWAVGASMQARRHLSGAEPSIELASLGRLCAEMEYEALRLLEAGEARSGATT
ncbi:MAG: phosphotransferase family protein [Vulcanimicrobiaceae bacterium]